MFNKQPSLLASSITERGTQIALVFALVVERLKQFYEDGQWLTQSQCTSLTGEWLARSKRTLPLLERRSLSDFSDQIAKQITESVSREAGLYISHELTEALDPNYFSEIAQSIIAECEQLLDTKAVHLTSSS